MKLKIGVTLTYVQDHASLVRPRSTSELLDVLAAMSSHSLAPGFDLDLFPLHHCMVSHSYITCATQGTQVRDCSWPSRVQGLQEVEKLLHICVLYCSVNAVHSCLLYGFKDSSTLLNLSEKYNVRLQAVLGRSWGLGGEL